MSKQNAKGGEDKQYKLKHARQDGGATGYSPQRPGDFQADDWVKYLRDKGVLRGWRRDGTQAGSTAFVVAAMARIQMVVQRYGLLIRKRITLIKSIMLG